VVTFVGQKNIFCLNDLATILKSDVVRKQRQVTFKLVNGSGNTENLKVTF